MKGKLVGCVVALALLAVTAAPATATHSAGVGPTRDFVYGTGSIFVFLPPFGAFDVQLHVNASADSPTTGARGRFWTELEGGLTVDLRGRVTCLNVEGHHATLSGVIERSSIGFPPVGGGILAFGVDNGEGANSGGDSVLGIPIGSPLRSCPPAVSDGVLIEGGNFVAHDAPPPAAPLPAP
jgi:hypothetical protein